MYAGIHVGAAMIPLPSNLNTPMEILAFPLDAAVLPPRLSILPEEQANSLRRGVSRSTRQEFVVPESSEERFYELVTDPIKRTVNGILSKRFRKVGECATMKPLTLPRCKFGPSAIPGAGNGIHATQPFKKGDIVGEYGGEVITAIEAANRRDLGESTHIRSVGRVVSSGFCLDGRIRGNFTKQYYVDNHLMGSFFNEGKSSQINCKYVEKACMHSQYSHPYKPGATSPAGTVGIRVFLVATRNGTAGEEFLVKYGPGYARHYNPET